MIKNKATAFMSGPMVTEEKDTGQMIKHMVKQKSFLLTVIFTKEIIRIINQMDRVYCITKMVPNMKVSG